MSRYYPNSKVPFQTTFTNDGTPTDVASISFKWKIGRNGDEITVVPTNVSTGVYTVDVVPTKSGNLYARWDTDGEFDTVVEPVIIIRRSAFEVSSSSDYAA